jgi:receptor protein-tyrosine kinase
MVSSALPGEGKSFIALNIAMSIAMERDSRVLLIDADTTRPSLSAILGAPLSQGLLDLLTNPALAPAQTLLRTNVERLTFLPSGTPRPNATELLASEAMERLVESLASRYTDRILIFDAPPLLAAPEPPVLASYMGQIVVVVEAQRTTHKAVQHALAAVEGCPVVMTVLNKCQRNGGLHEYYSRAAS